MGELVGYARVSRIDQHPELQLDDLRRAGCERVFTDHGVSGAAAHMPERAKLREYVRKGDVVVVWHLSRFGRSRRDVEDRILELRERQIGFRSLREAFDLDTPAGRLMAGLMALWAEFERELLIERTRAGIAAARARGRQVGGRRVMTEAKLDEAIRLRTDDKRTVADVCEILGVSRATLFRAIAARSAATPGA